MCDEGYKVMSGRTWFTMQCMNTGELECPPGLLCECTKETCYDLTPPKNTTRIPNRISGDVGSYGDVIEFRCNGELKARAEGVEDVADFLAARPEDEEESLEQAVGRMSKKQLRQMDKAMHRGKLQVRCDGVIDPFTNQAKRLGSVGLGVEAMRRLQSGRR
jgi:hypothetical protein